MLTDEQKVKRLVEFISIEIEWFSRYKKDPDSFILMDVGHEKRKVNTLQWRIDKYRGVLEEIGEDVNTAHVNEIIGLVAYKEE